MSRPTAAERQAMRQRWQASTPGEWEPAQRDDDFCSSQCGIEAGGKWVISTESPGPGIPACSDADEDFIVTAHQDVPTLLDARDEAEREVRRLKVLVAFVRGLVDEDQAMVATGMTRLALRDWRGDVSREGAALVQAAGEGKG